MIWFVCVPTQISPQYQNTAVGTETRNRVLRNTYGQLALSMIPTVIGAWIGVAMLSGRNARA